MHLIAGFRRVPYCDVSWLWAFIITLHPDGLFGSKSAGDDCVIQTDHCREQLVFWCFGVHKITTMIAKYYWLGLENFVY
ncbi:predicted protein [Lichtheimia corymbifera JMRC:FSU:9682]|uniref:Uncharacterized protein n=1 Tax=Lichtheimia corymbifera JMRC:FSU:9682 TaxID=1263082 RepID=A0A068S2C2_9FUNG|nr:predicted protein [Lichtheimia corymbifera JMRC:FSU:9682]